MRYLTTIVSYFIASVFTQYATAQVSYLSAGKPEQGKPITIYYKATADTKLNRQDSIFAGIQYWDEHGAVFKRTGRMQKSDTGTWSVVYELPKDVAYLSIRFYNLSVDDDNAAIDQMIYRGGIPARGATYQDFSGAKLQQSFKEEITRYPDNYYAYARYMYALPADTLAAKLPELTAKLLTVKNRDDGVLSALVVAYVKQGKKEEAYTLLLELLEKYPATAATDFTLSFFLYEQYKAGGSMLATGKIYELLRDIFIRYPEARVAGSYNTLMTFSNDTTIPTTAFENVVGNLYKNGLVDYLSMGVLPNIYLKRNTKLDEAGRLLNQAIHALISGEICHQVRLPPTYIYTYTADYLRKLGMVYTRLNRTSEAILTISSALHQVKGSSFEGSLRPVLEVELADAFSKAGNLSVALDLYKKIYTAGNEKVKDSVTSLYLKIADKAALDAFLVSVAKKGPSTNGLTAAPAFSGTDLAGKPVQLSDYKGKIVVINAWFIGCVPCIAEMPDLNKLVSRYADQKDVVFLAITPDKTDALDKFLKKTAFNYRIVNNLKGIEAYEINMYPQHIVIDRSGNIVYRTAGSTPGMSEKLTEVIEKQKK